MNLAAKSPLNTLVKVMMCLPKKFAKQLKGGKPMLFRGMKATNKSGLIIAFFVFLVLLLSLLIIFANHKKKQHRDPNDYCEKLFLLLETSNEIMMKDVFDFAFDKAYVAAADETYGDEEYFLKKLDVDTNIDIPILESGAHSRILFIKDNRIIYDFVYEMEKVCVLKTGIWAFPNTTIILTQQNSIHTGETVIQIDLEERQGTA